MLEDPRDADLALSRGRVRARRHGDGGDPLVLGIPGLTANLVSLDAIAAAQPMVALDLRGRGHSEVTGPGTYGWTNHAADVADAATALGAGRFRMVGWSMGAYVAMEVARQAPERVLGVVLIDALGPVDDAVVSLVKMSASRLGAVHPSLSEYLALVRSTGMIDPWGEVWERYFEYELAPVPGGVRPRTDRGAVEEDMAYGEAQSDPEPYWAALTMPVLVIRALRPMLPGSRALVIAPDLLERFRRAVPAATVVEVDANHYGVGTHPVTARAVAGFFGRVGA